MMVIVNAYNVYSKSANALADALKVPLNNKIIQLVRGASDTTIINWGDGDFNIPDLNKARLFNKPEAIKVAVNKLKSFNVLKEAGVSIPQYTTDKAVAKHWLTWGDKVVARLRLEGKDGDGIKLCSKVEELPDAKLYVKFIPNCTEFRVNTFLDRTVGVQKKVPVANANHNHEIKTTSGGYGLHLLSEHEIIVGLRPLAKAAIKALGLDFGGVDIIRDSSGNLYVLEVNTAPELTPSMVAGYAKKFTNEIYYDNL